MPFNGIVTPPMQKYLAASSTSTSTIQLPAVATSAPSNYYRTMKENPEDSYSSEDTRCRGIAIYPIAENITSEENKQFEFALVGWRKVVNTSNPPGDLEWRPIILWQGYVVIGTSTGGGGGLGTAFQFADEIVETKAVPPAFGGFAGFSALLHSPKDNTEAFLAIPDLSHVIDGVTLLFNRNGGPGGSAEAATKANVMIQSIF